MLLITAAVCGLNADAATRTVCEFGNTSYEGWTYTRDNIELTASNISLRQIRLRGTYTLISPELNCAGLDSLQVVVVYATGTKTYTVSKLALEFTLKDTNDSVLSTVTVPAAAGVVSQEMAATLLVPKDVMTLTLSAPNADIDNCAAVQSVVITGYGSDKLAGDINGDGVVDITDVNVEINGVLYGDTSSTYDVNGDGIVDITDVNEAINLVLFQ